MSVQKSNSSFFITILKKLFGSCNKTPKKEAEITRLVYQACNEIDDIIRYHAFELVTRGDLLGRYIDIRIASDMLEIAIANVTFEKPIYIQDENGKFTYPPTENPQKIFKIKTTQNLNLDGISRQNYLQKLATRLHTHHFTVCSSFRFMKDSNILFSYADLGKMEDHSPDMLLYTDF